MRYSDINSDEASKRYIIELRHYMDMFGMSEYRTDIDVNGVPGVLEAKIDRSSPIPNSELADKFILYQSKIKVSVYGLIGDFNINQGNIKVSIHKSRLNKLIVGIDVRDVTSVRTDDETQIDELHIMNGHAFSEGDDVGRIFWTNKMYLHFRKRCIFSKRKIEEFFTRASVGKIYMIVPEVWSSKTLLVYKEFKSDKYLQTRIKDLEYCIYCILKSVRKLNMVDGFEDVDKVRVVEDKVMITFKGRGCSIKLSDISSIRGILRSLIEHRIRRDIDEKDPWRMTTSDRFIIVFNNERLYR